MTTSRPQQWGRLTRVMEKTAMWTLIAFGIGLQASSWFAFFSAYQVWRLTSQ